jgi:hypothetical protein
MKQDDFSMFSKGDIVSVFAVVYTKGFPPFWLDRVGSAEVLVSPDETKIFTRTRLYPRTLKRQQVKEFRGMVIGQSTLLTGWHEPAGYDTDGSGDFLHPKTHRVLLVEPIDTRRYKKPVSVLPVDCVKSVVQFTSFYSENDVHNL